MKPRRRLRNAALLLVTAMALSLGLTGCEEKNQAKSDKSAEVKKTTKSEHPAGKKAAEKKPKDHPAH